MAKVYILSESPVEEDSKSIETTSIHRELTEKLIFCQGRGGSIDLLYGIRNEKSLNKLGQSWAKLSTGLAKVIVNLVYFLQV